MPPAAWNLKHWTAIMQTFKANTLFLLTFYSSRSKDLTTYIPEEIGKRGYELVTISESYFEWKTGPPF